MEETPARRRRGRRIIKKIQTKYQESHFSKLHGTIIILIALIIAAIAVLATLFIARGQIGDTIKNANNKDGCNLAIKACCFDDKEAPEIVLNGDAEITIDEGTEYIEHGATASDNCDGEIEVKIDGVVDINKAGTYIINYSATDAENNTASITRTVTINAKPQAPAGVTVPDGPKIVYLTFDDGPGPDTSRLLDVLKKYNVKATFFVTCNRAQYRDMITRASNEGHTIGLHTCTHNYASIYANDDAYFNDLNSISSLVKELTGKESKLVRFPGGSSNTVSKQYSKGIISRTAAELGRRGYAYFDWNVSSGDAGGAKDTETVYNNVVSRLRGDYSIVLQHDVNSFSVDAVENIIKYGLANGFTFKALDISSPTAHHSIGN